MASCHMGIADARLLTHDRGRIAYAVSSARIRFAISTAARPAL